MNKFSNYQEIVLINARGINRLIILGTIALLFLTPNYVYAHDASTVEKFGSFLGGLFHPILGLDHLLAMLSVGIVSAQLGGKAIWTVPSTFVIVMGLGGLLGLGGLSFGGVETGIAVSVVVLGVVILANKSIPIAIVMTAVGLFAVFHGYAHGIEMPDIAQPAQYALGFLSGTAAIHLTGVLIGDIPGHYKYGSVILRGMGGVFALVGILFLVGVL